MTDYFRINLQRLIDERGLSLSELSRKSSVGASTLSMYLRDKNRPMKDATKLLLCRALHVDPKEMDSPSGPTRIVIKDEPVYLGKASPEGETPEIAKFQKRMIAPAPKRQETGPTTLPLLSNEALASITDRGSFEAAAKASKSAPAPSRTLEAARKTGECVFAYSVFTTAAAPSILPGYTVYALFSRQAALRSGGFVLAAINGTVVLRQYVGDEFGNGKLIATNPDWAGSKEIKCEGVIANVIAWFSASTN